jgi:hypothetical protein
VAIWFKRDNLDPAVEFAVSVRRLAQRVMNEGSYFARAFLAREMRDIPVTVIPCLLCRKRVALIFALS